MDSSKPMPGLALVTGATGFVGSHLVDLLLDRGWRVRCTVRKSSRLRWLEGKDVERVEWDLRTVGAAGRACEGVDVVFHAAGLVHASSRAEFRDGNWLVSKIMVESAVRAGVRRFVHVSSLAAAGPSPDGAPVEESMPPRPVSMYGRSKWQGEQEVRRHAGEIEVTVVRPPVVYGPRDAGLVEMYRVMAYGIQPRIGGRKRLSLIHVRDLAEGILRAAESEGAAGQVYYLSDGEPRTFEATTSCILRALGKKRWIRLSIPDALVRALGTAAEWLALPGRFNRDKALEMTRKNWICSSVKAERELGFSARTPLSAGMAETMDWCRSAGILPLT